jgi:glycosyltransferase involved in cell wall biosynthesis
MDKISVVIPTYNNGHTIRRCLDSILKQTHKNYEVIIVDDGSTDNNAELIRPYLKDARFFYLYKSNGGVSSARNVGMKLATGDYIQFLDGDDDFMPNTFEKTINAAKETDADVVIFKFKHDCWKSFIQKGTYNRENRQDFLKLYSDFFACELPWNKLIRRSVISASYDEGLKIFEGIMFFLDNAQIKKVTVLDDELVNYYNAGAVDKASAVNGFLKSKFWENKQGYWHRLFALESRFRGALLKIFNNVDDFMQVRTFDMAFIELVKLIHAEVPAENIAQELNLIFNEPAFKRSVNYFGSHVGAVTIGMCEEYVCECARCYKLINLKKLGGEPYFTYIDLFFKHITQSNITADAIRFEELLERKVNA